MQNDLNALVSFVLEKAEQEPPRKRAALYRGLAIVCGDKKDQGELRIMACAFLHADDISRAFKSSFVQKTLEP